MGLYHKRKQATNVIDRVGLEGLEIMLKACVREGLGSNFRKEHLTILRFFVDFLSPSKTTSIGLCFGGAGFEFRKGHWLF
jgi:hypothetical protein